MHARCAGGAPWTCDWWPAGTPHRDEGRPHDPYYEAIASLPLQAHPPDSADNGEPRAAGRRAVPWATVAIILAVLPLVVAGGALVLRFRGQLPPRC
jgi:hypothetical protein